MVAPTGFIFVRRAGVLPPFAVPQLTCHPEPKTLKGVTAETSEGSCGVAAFKVVAWEYANS